MFLNGYIYVDVINGARQCAEENKMQKPRMWSEKQSCSKQMAESPTEQEKLETLRRKLGQRKFLMDHFSLKQKHWLQVVTHPK